MFPTAVSTISLGRDDTFPNPQLRRLSVEPFFESAAVALNGQDLLQELSQVDKTLDRLEETFLFEPAWEAWRVSDDRL
jgi:hypothetical protein